MLFVNSKAAPRSLASGGFLLFVVTAVTHYSVANRGATAVLPSRTRVPSTDAAGTWPNPSELPTLATPANSSATNRVVLQVVRLRLFIHFTVLFCSCPGNLIFQNFRPEHERHSLV